MGYKNKDELEKIIKGYENKYKKALKVNDLATLKKMSNIKLISDDSMKNLYICLKCGKKEISKSFVFRYSFNNSLKTLSEGFSKYPFMSINEARDKARQYNDILLSSAYKETKRDLKTYLEYKNNKILSFKEIVAKWLESLNVSEYTLESYKKNLRKALKVFGNMQFSQITKSDLIAFLKEYEVENKIAMLSRLYKLLSQIYRWALNYDLIDLESNPFLKMNRKMFKKYIPKHHKALNQEKLKEILINLEKFEFKFNQFTIKSDKKPLYYYVCKFMIYTPLRIYNIAFLQWNEVDFENKMLRIPALKMKANKDLELPLSSQSLEILQYMYKKKIDNFVFSHELIPKFQTTLNINKAIKKYLEIKGINENELKKQTLKYNLIREIAIKYNVTFRSVYRRFYEYKNLNKPLYRNIKVNQENLYDILSHDFRKWFGFTAHQTRATFSTSNYEKTKEHNLDFTIIEMCLAHDIGNQVIRSYNHSVRMIERRELMQFWSDYVDSLNATNEVKRVGNGSFIFNSSNAFKIDNTSQEFVSNRLDNTSQNSNAEVISNTSQSLEYSKDLQNFTTKGNNTLENMESSLDFDTLEYSKDTSQENTESSKEFDNKDLDSNDDKLTF